MRLGVVCPTEVPLWIRTLVEALDKDPSIEVVALISGPRQTTKIPLRWLLKFDSWLFASRRAPDALECAPMTDDLKGQARSIEIEDGRLPDPQCSFLRSLSLDLVLDPLGTISKYDSEVATHGAWRGDIGSSGVFDHIAIWESILRVPVTRYSLWRQGAATNRSTCIGAGYSSTRTESPSVNSSRAYWLLSNLIFDCLRDNRGRLNAVEAVGIDGADQQLEQRSTWWVLWVYLSRLAIKSIRNAFVWTRWCLLFADTPGETNLAKFSVLKPPADEFWADPWLIERDGQTHLFFEVYRKDIGRGHVAHMELKDNKGWSEPQIVLEQSNHLSYPSLFECDGEVYMIPETKELRTVDLYRCARFPSVWKKQKTLLSEITAADATMLHYRNKWWLFLSETRFGEETTGELHIYFADHPLLDDCWIPHRRNPVVRDARHARQAGRFLWRGGKPIRVAQDCSYRYGYGLKFLRIDELTESEYSETEIVSIEPDGSRMLGVHSYSTTSKITVVDGLMAAKRIPRLMRR